MARYFLTSALLLAPVALAADSCAQACIDAHSKCQTTPVNGASPNQSLCAAEYAACLGYNPYPTASGETYQTPTACSKSAAPTYPAPSAAPSYGADLSSCAKDCLSKWDACRTTPGSNQSKCSSDYAACLNFNPFTQSGTFSTPTACSAASSTASSTAAPSTTSAAGGQLSPCAQGCLDKWNTCRTSRPGGLSANMAACASDYAACLNFNPFTQSGTFSTPTACATSSGASSTAPAPGTPTSGGGAVTQTNTIVNPPSTATSLVTSQASQPTGAAPAPATSASVTPVLNNGAGSLNPANFALLGLGLFFL